MHERTENHDSIQSKGKDSTKYYYSILYLSQDRKQNCSLLRTIQEQQERILKCMNHFTYQSFPANFFRHSSWFASKEATSLQSSRSYRKRDPHNPAKENYELPKVHYFCCFTWFERHSVAWKSFPSRISTGDGTTDHPLQQVVDYG